MRGQQHVLDCPEKPFAGYAEESPAGQAALAETGIMGWVLLKAVCTPCMLWSAAEAERLRKGCRKV